jgi:hypothetical protein
MYVHVQRDTQTLATKDHASTTMNVATQQYVPVFPMPSASTPLVVSIAIIPQTHLESVIQETTNVDHMALAELLEPIKMIIPVTALHPVTN